MAPNTRSTRRQNTPPKHRVNTEWDTPQKSRFFQVFDQGYSLRASAKDQGVPLSTAKDWTHYRKQYGSPAVRHTRRISKKLGRREKLTPEQCAMLVSPSKNPVRKQLYEAQIQYHSLGVTRRTLQRSLLKHTRNARKYLMPYTNKELKQTHRDNRVEWAKRHLGKTINNF
jgi:hypothetical protein